MLARHWGVDAELSRLEGEYDLNLLAEGSDSHILKVMRAGCEPAVADMQCRALEHLRVRMATALPPNALPFPRIQRTLSGELFATVVDECGEPRSAWLMGRLPGIPYALWRPHTPQLAHDLGRAAAQADLALASFGHPMLYRRFKWNLTDALWIADRYHDLLNPSRCAILDGIVRSYRAIQNALNALPTTAIHNDLNDYNILVGGSINQPALITGLTDTGDMCAAPRVCELAIAGAYVVLGHHAPMAQLSALVGGYHAEWPLTPHEVDLIWPLLRMRLAVSVVNSALAALERPDDTYLVISEKPAWYFLENHGVNGDLAGMRLRAACGMPVTDNANHAERWLDETRGRFAPVLGRDLSSAPMRSLSVHDSTTPEDPFSITRAEAACLGTGSGSGRKTWLGYYGEPRLIYTEPAYLSGRSIIDNRRTVHLGIDVFTAPGSPVHTPLEATVFHAGVRPDYLDYGGLAILRHVTSGGVEFFTLYGHLAPNSIAGLYAGQRLERGECFASVGDVAENGGWNPHLHFQLGLAASGLGNDWPGAVDPDEFLFWQKACPNPAALLNLPDSTTSYGITDRAAVINGRQERMGANVRLSYNVPVMFLRGWRHFLFDEWGRAFLDCYNNVPHVGHAHPRIQSAATRQLKLLNTNTRYLHPAPIAFADRILSRLPGSLSVCYFVNSGSEANELALRLARAHTGGRDMITPDHGYHGNTTGAMAISAYKFHAKGGAGRPEWVELIELADDYRGSFRRDDPDRAEKYAALTDDAIARIAARGGRLAGFIAETFPSVGGQIIPPEGYLAGVYGRIRAANGVCIADEVQTALGRLGKYYYAFEQQQVVPDILVLGKPIGNGHPIGVVVTTREIAASFSSGPEFFSTFGGSTLSCVIGSEVLDIVEDEHLMENARTVGSYLLARLSILSERYDIIGDVRGVGLFIGIEFVESAASRRPAGDIADYVRNRLCENRILAGTEGPADNVLKIRPPLTFDHESADTFLEVFGEIVAEAELRIA